MEVSKDIQEYVQALKASKRLGGQVVFHKVIPEEPATWGEPLEAWPGTIEQMLRDAGIQKLFVHQAQAIDFVRAGEHVVVATPTASGKTLIYNLMVMERFLVRPDSKALFMFPLKALAQDQLLNLNKFTASLEGRRPTAAIYDGDTSPWHRKRIREKPPNVIMTNPEMLHSIYRPHRQPGPDGYFAAESSLTAKFEDDCVHAVTKNDRTDCYLGWNPGRGICRPDQCLSGWLSSGRTTRDRV